MAESVVVQPCVVLVTDKHQPMQAIGVLFLVTATFPARILAKLVYLVIGFAFWVVVPVLRALTPDELSR